MNWLMQKLEGTDYVFGARFSAVIAYFAAIWLTGQYWIVPALVWCDHQHPQARSLALGLGIGLLSLVGSFIWSWAMNAPAPSRKQNQQ